MYNAFSDFENLSVVSVSPWAKARSARSKILGRYKNLVILNGVDTSIFSIKPTERLRDKLNLTNCKVVLNVSASFTDDESSIKGGHHVLELARRFTGSNVYFIVIGHHNISCEVPENLILVGSVLDQELLAEYYSMADVTLITSKKETFGMPVAESLCCGTPVVGYKSGGPESITLTEYSEFVENGNICELEDILRKWLLLKDTVLPREISEKAQSKYSNLVMASQYIDLYRSHMMNKNMKKGDK